MSTPNSRRVTSVLAGVLAMAASTTALATLCWSDFAQASELQHIELADDVMVPPPVKVAKIEHKRQLEKAFPRAMREPRKMGKRKARLDFGSFEGY